MCAHEA
jgi:hypothetical protein